MAQCKAWEMTGWLGRRPCYWRGMLAGLVFQCTAASGPANVYLLDVPDYDWYAGCFGTASGNLMGYWDRHGFPDFYTGAAGNGLAPLDNFGVNRSVRAMWATRAGQDGRPADQPGHMDDYYVEYESTAPDPYVVAGRPEHSPDCIGDFIGLSQRKWTMMNGECDGNIDGYSFVYWDQTGGRRVHTAPGGGEEAAPVDLASGLASWTHWRAGAAEVFSQLTEFDPTIPSGTGFTFDDLKAEIDAGYPMIFFLQDFTTYSRSFPGMPHANPNIHGILAYGYVVAPDGTGYVRFRSSWASGDFQFNVWTGDSWLPGAPISLPLRGVIGYRPRPQVKSLERSTGGWTLRWQGPASDLVDAETGAVTRLHRYVVEQATSLSSGAFVALHAPTDQHEMEILECCTGIGTAFLRVRLVEPETR